MSDAKQLIDDAIAWLRGSYSEHQFFLERDVVWSIQRSISRLIQERRMSHRVFNDHPIVPGHYRSLCTDIAIVDVEGVVQAAMEVKYEPAHHRKGIDIWPSKFGPTVVFWEKVVEDINRIQTFVAERRALYACSLFVDEGGYFHDRKPAPSPLSRWIDWGNGTRILHSESSALISTQK